MSLVRECHAICAEMQREIERRAQVIGSLEDLFFAQCPQQAMLCDNLLREIFFNCEPCDIFYGSFVCTRWNKLLEDPRFLRDFFSTKAPNIFQAGKELPLESWRFYGRAQLKLGAIDARREKIEEETANVWNFAAAVIKRFTLR